MLEQDRSETATLMRVGHDEGDLRRASVTDVEQAFVPAHRDDLVAEDRHEGDAVAVIDRREVDDVPVGHGGVRAEVPQVAGAFGQLAVELDEFVGVLGNDRPQMDDTPVRREYVGEPVARKVPRAFEIDLLAVFGGAVSHGDPPDRGRAVGTWRDESR